MAKNSPQQPAQQVERDPLIKTASEVAAMSEAERQAFRAAGGTATSDPKPATSEPES